MYNLYNHIDNQYNIIYYKFAYKFCYDNNYQKDLYIITNYANSHYMLLFSKKHNAIKINNLLLLNQPLLNNNKRNNTDNLNQGKENTNNLKKNYKLYNDNEENKYKNIKDSKTVLKTEVNNNYDIYNINIELTDFNNLSLNDILAKYAKNDIKNKIF